MGIVKKEEINDIDQVERDLIKQGKLKENTGNQYVNNKELYNELIKFHEKKLECLEQGLPIPPFNDKIGSAIIQIATRRCNSRSYYRYTNSWKEEMISNAIATAAIRGHNFDPNKSSNPFAYFTQICDSAIKEQIKKEKKQLYIKYKSIDNARGYMAQEDENSNEDNVYHDEVDIAYEDRLKFINDYEDRNFSKKKEESEEDKGIFR
jgi:hypothetical protein